MNVKYHLLASCVFWCCSFEYVFCSSCCNQTCSKANGTDNKLKCISIDKWYDCTNDFYNDELIKVWQEVFVKFEKSDLGVNLRLFTDNKDSLPVTMKNLPVHVILFVMTPKIYWEQSEVVKKLCRKVIGNVEFYYTLSFVLGEKDLKKFPLLKQSKDDVNKYEFVIKV